MMKSAARVFAVCSALWLASAALAQEVIFSNIAPTDQFFAGTWVIGNIPPSPVLSNYRTTGSRFVSTAGQDLELGAVQAPIEISCLYPTVPGTCDTPPAGSQLGIWLNIYANDGASPGALLARSSTVLVSPDIQVHSFGFSSGVVLQAGATYWIQADVGPSNLGGGWATNRRNDLGLAIWGNGGTSQAFNTYLPGSIAPAYRVLSVVPEPRTWLLFAVAVPIFLLLRQRPLQVRPLKHVSAV